MLEKILILKIHHCIPHPRRIETCAGHFEILIKIRSSDLT